MRRGARTAGGRLLLVGSLLALVPVGGVVALRGAGYGAEAPAPGRAPPPQPVPRSAGSGPGAVLTARELEKFADSVFAEYLRRSPEPSLALVVVRGRDVLLQRGYGLEDARTRRPVDPESTVFHVASVSKLITATAALQLVERGRLRLHEDVNRSPGGFVIRGRAGDAPITLWHLLTHTSGLDGPFLRAVVTHPSELVPLGEYFARYPPRRGRPPGREIRYSNEGMALVGHLVERAAGEPFPQYVERHLFQPLGMSRSSFRQPPPPPIAARLATAGSGPVPDALLPYPAGSMVSTAADMGRFLRAHLGGGELEGVRILADSSVRRMHARQWSADRRLPGVALGFFETEPGGVRGLFHTGARTHFSLLYLLPEQGIGIFLVHAMRQGGEFQHLRVEFVRAFLGRYSPPPPEAHAQPPGAGQRARAFAGGYRPILVAGSTIERAAWLGLDTPVAADPDGHLSLRILGGPRLRLAEVGDGLYRVPHGPHEGVMVAFRRRADGAVTGMALAGGFQDPVSFERLAWYEHGRLHAAVLGLAFLLFLSCAAGAAARGVWRRVRGRRAQAGRVTSREERLARAIARLAGGLALLSPVSVAGLVLARPGDDPAADGLRLALTVGLALLLAAAVLGLALVPFAVRAWRSTAWTTAGRWYLSALALAALVAVPLLAYYHLLGFWWGT